MVAKSDLSNDGREPLGSESLRHHLASGWPHGAQEGNRVSAGEDSMMTESLEQKAILQEMLGRKPGKEQSPYHCTGAYTNLQP